MMSVLKETLKKSSSIKALHFVIDAIKILHQVYLTDLFPFYYSLKVNLLIFSNAVLSFYLFIREHKVDLLNLVD